MWYELMDILDKLHPKIENVVFFVVGVGFFVLYGLFFYIMGRRK